MAGRLEGKVAIVTGAGRGIGRGEALALAREGVRVIVNDIGGSTTGEGSDQTPADEVVAEIKKMGGDAVANYGNVTSMEDGEKAVKQALDTFGRLDILVNNAGILRDRIIFNMTEEEWDAVIAVHLKGHFTITRFASMVFRQQRSGRIVNTSSESGLGNLGQANYSAAKEGITGMTRTLALDLGKYGVTANAIRPRAATRMTLSPEMEAARKKREEMAAAGKLEEKRPRRAFAAGRAFARHGCPAGGVPLPGPGLEHQRPRLHRRRERDQPDEPADPRADDLPRGWLGRRRAGQGVPDHAGRGRGEPEAGRNRLRQSLGDPDR